MNVFHFDDYKRGAKEICDYLEDNSNIEEFNTVHEYFQRIEAACKDTCKDILVKKDIPVWLTVFSRFAKCGLEDSKFAEFIHELSGKLHSIDVNGVSYDSLNKESGTTDKKLVVAKINTYTALMNEFLHIDTREVNDTELENNNTEESAEDNTEESVLSFVQENANPNVTDEDINLYTDMVEDCVKIDDPVYKECGMALVALMAYACQNDKDQDFEKWIENYRNKSDFSSSQKVNYTYMKRSFDNFIANA